MEPWRRMRRTAFEVLEGGSKFRVESMDGRVYGDGPIS
jgi:hypothetical protein